MRRQLLLEIKSQLVRALGAAFPGVKDISADPGFSSGDIGLRLGQSGPLFFFIALVAAEQDDSFQVLFAWNSEDEYPSQPFGDLRASLADYLGHETGEFHMALFSKDLPGSWYLDQTFGQWKESLENAMAGTGRLDPHEHSKLLKAIPKRCSIPEGIAAARMVADEVASALRKYAAPFMERLACGRYTPSQDHGYAIAVSALRFFCLGATAQVAAARDKGGKSVPIFFEQNSEGNLGCDFFYSVACVLKAYQGYPLDRLPAGRESDSSLGDFIHRLDVAMNDLDPTAWSETAVLQSELWQRLRRDAGRALEELGESSAGEAPQFDFEVLFDPDEFRTSDEAKRLLSD